MKLLRFHWCIVVFVVILGACQVLSACNLTTKVSQPPKDLRNGDIIFLQSQTSQAVAFEEATASIWTHTGIILWHNNQWMVAEASATVRYTPLEQFIAKGKQQRYVIKRLKNKLFPLDSDTGRNLENRVANFLGRPYDIYFRWDDASIYCSELVWKVYEPFVRLTEPQKMKDLDLSGPQVKKLILERYRHKGKALNLEETVVTPISIFNSSRLYQVYDSSGN
jgi:hypothetical protein